MLQQPATFDGLLFDAEAKGADFVKALRAIEKHLDQRIPQLEACEREGQLEVMCRLWESIGLAEGAIAELVNVERKRARCHS